MAAASGEHAVTWQPSAGVREAVVASPWPSATAQGVAVAGISLAAAERRTDALRSGVAIGWVLAWLAMMLAAAVTARHRRFGGAAAPGPGSTRAETVSRTDDAGRPGARSSG